MPRKQPKTLSPKARKEYYSDLAKVIAELDNEEQVEHFLTDLLSETEMLMIARRLRIASLLLAGNSYNDIAASIGASPNTVSQVHQWLQKDNADLAKIQKQLRPLINKRDIAAASNKPERKEYAKPGTMAWMRQRYPVHFLLFNIFSSK